MRPDVTEQIRDYFEFLDEEQVPSRTVVDDRDGLRFDPATDVVASPAALSASQARVWWAAAAVVVVIVGFVLVQWLAPLPTADTAVPTTLPVSPSTIGVEGDRDVPQVEFPGVPESEIMPDSYRPFGETVVAHSVSESLSIPYGNAFESRWGKLIGGIVKTETGYVAVAGEGGPQHLAFSSDGVGWTPIETNLNLEGDVRGRLFQVGGWYWIETLVPTRLFRSQDLVSWDEVDLPIPADNSLSPVGFPFSDRRFTPFNQYLVAFGETIISVDVQTGQVEQFDRPWEIPPSYWLTSVVIGGELSVFVASYPDIQPGPVGDTVTQPEQWTTEDLTDWEGPNQPEMTVDGITLLGVDGTPDIGYVATQAAPEGRGFRAAHMFSANGKDWTPFDTPWETAFDYTYVTPTKIDGRQALVTVGEPAGRFSLFVSSDGSRWQEIPLGVPTFPEAFESVRARVTSLIAVDSTLFYYERVGDVVNAWTVRFGSDDG